MDNPLSTTLDLANYLRSLTPRDRENLKRGIQLTEATASAELATHPTPETES